MKKIFQYVTGIGLVILIIFEFINIMIIDVSKDKITGNIESLQKAEAVIILGASVRNNKTLSPILQERAEAGLHVYQSGLVQKILVSGDNSTPNYNEVVPVRTYLIDAGVPESDIFLDFAGFDTYDSMYRAQSIFQVESAIIVTQSFHLPRAVYIADKLGITVQGFIPPHNFSSWKNFLREFGARIKAFFDIAFHSKPTYEGIEIPIQGDGRKSLE